jgi:hypothetical protein
LKRFAIALACALAGYVAAALASYFLVLQLSSNVHDRAIEAAMTSIFFFGPIGAVFAFIAGFILFGRHLVRAGNQQIPQ